MNYRNFLKIDVASKRLIMIIKLEELLENGEIQ